MRLAVAVGLVGAYTTFSTFEYETARLLEGKDFLDAFLYVVLSFAIGFGAVWAGMMLARQVEGVPITSRIAEEYWRGPIREPSEEDDTTIVSQENDSQASDRREPGTYEN